MNGTVNAADRRLLGVRNPRTGQVDHQLAVPAAAEVAETARRLRAAQPAWAALPLPDRLDRLRGLRAALETHGAEIAAALEADTGRRRIARLELAGVLAAIDGWCASAPSLLPQGWTAGRGNPAIRHAPHWVPYPLVGIAA